MNDCFKLRLIICCALQNLFNSSNAVFSFQASNHVEMFFNLCQALRIIFDITFVATNARSDILQTKDRLRKVCFMFLKILIKKREFIESLERGSQLIER